MNKSESIENLAKALSAFQSEVRQPSKDADNPFFKSKYVALPAVIAAIKETAPKHGLSYTQAPVSSEKGIGVQTIILHNSGEFIEHPPFFLPLEKQTSQSGGSAITYAKRYSLSAAFGIDSEFDDDGNAASGNSSTMTTDVMTEVIFEATKKTMILAKTDKSMRSPAETLKAAKAKMTIKPEYLIELEKLVK